MNNYMLFVLVGLHKASLEMMVEVPVVLHASHSASCNSISRVAFFFLIFAANCV